MPEELSLFIGEIAARLWREPDVIRFSIVRADGREHSFNVLEVQFNNPPVVKYAFTKSDTEVQTHGSGGFAKRIVETILEEYRSKRNSLLKGG